MCLFHRALRKYGKENFEWSILFEDSSYTWEQLGKKEIELITLRKTFCEGYNMTSGGNGGDILTNNPKREEILKKRSATVKGMKYKPMSEETKKTKANKISLKLKGKKLLKITGEKHWTHIQGKEKTKQKIGQGMLNSEKWKKSIKSVEYSNNMSNALKNSKKHQEACKRPEKNEKIRKALTYVPSLEQIQKVIFMYVEKKYCVKQIEEILQFSSHYIKKILKSNNIQIERTRRPKCQTNAK